MNECSAFAQWPEDLSRCSRAGGSPGDRPVLVRGLERVTEVTAGLFHSIALCADGRVWGWGRNLFGTLATGNRRDSRVPVAVDGLRSVVAISAGANHSIAVTSDGSVWTWGAHRLYRLADPLALTPVRVPGIREAMAVAAGAAHSLVLTADGTVWGWGENSLGQLGDGGTDDDAPRQICLDDAIVDDVVAIAADEDRSLALRSDGSVLTWGLRLSPAPPVAPRAVPRRLARESKAILALEKGFRHSIALTVEGLVWAWGDNHYGQLGVPLRLFGR